MLGVGLLQLILYRSVFGLRLRAVGDKPQAARALGVSVPAVRMAAVLSGLLTAVGGSTWSSISGSSSPSCPEEEGFSPWRR